MKISVGQALLILIDKYKKNSPRLLQLKKHYLSGEKDVNSLQLINQYLTDYALKNYEVSRDHEVINNDDSRRYFETQLAYKTLENNIGQLELNDLQQHLNDVKAIAPDYYCELWDHVIDNFSMSGDDTEKEYADYLKKLATKKIFKSLSDEDRAKVSAMVASSFVGIIIASNRPEALPLDIYGEGIYLQRGKLNKQVQKTRQTKAYGLLKGHSPIPTEDPALMKDIQTFIKPSDQSTYDITTLWVSDNFARLVHPFSNSISGTMLCQMRSLLKVRETLKTNEEIDQNSLALSDEKIKVFITTFIAAMLFNSGGHSLYEYTALLELEKVQEAFQASRYLVKDLVHPWTKSTRQRDQYFGLDRPASGTLR